MRPVRVPAADLEQPGAEKACARVRAGPTLGTRPGRPAFRESREPWASGLPAHRRR